MAGPWVASPAFGATRSSTMGTEVADARFPAASSKRAYTRQVPSAAAVGKATFAVVA